MTVKVLGGGLAGCEAALTLAANGIDVVLVDGKPDCMTAAHHNTALGEIVCSNSLKSNDPTTASGLLKAELRLLGSHLISIADTVQVPAGGALAVDRDMFAALVTEKVLNNSHIRYISQRIDDWDVDEPTIIATGPLTMDGLSSKIIERLGTNLHFYDAAAPIIDAESIDMNVAFVASRYGKGGDDYINCPMNREQYEAFYHALVGAESVVLHEFERTEIFEGCMPIEVMAKRGMDTIRFGPLKPVGFTDPHTGKRPYALVQLRREKVNGSSFNLVGFQTNLKIKEQQRVFRMIPGLENCEFLRYGVMHRNSYINSPEVANKYLQLHKHNNTFVAGQLSGVEGYVESIATGLIAALNIGRYLSGKSMIELPQETIVGSLTGYLATPNKNFQPMNANFGLLPPLEENVRDKKLKKQLISERSLQTLKKSLQTFDLFIK